MCHQPLITLILWAHILVATERAMTARLTALLPHTLSASCEEENPGLPGSLRPPRAALSAVRENHCGQGRDGERKHGERKLASVSENKEFVQSPESA